MKKYNNSFYLSECNSIIEKISLAAFLIKKNLRRKLK
jgi:hypothetical protein